MRRLSRLRACAVAVLVSLCVPLLLPALAGAAAAYTKESKQGFEAQLKKGEVASAAINHTVGTVRLTLKDGRHFKYHWAAGGQAGAEAQLKAHGVTATEIQSKKKKSKSLGSHPRRTIAIIVVVVIVVLGAAFLLVRRRRMTRD